jgi:hypothetical protein
MNSFHSWRYTVPDIGFLVLGVGSFVFFVIAAEFLWRV